MIRNSVDLPHPLGPINTVVWRSARRSVVGSSTLVPPNDFATSTSSSIAILVLRIGTVDLVQQPLHTALDEVGPRFHTSFRFPFLGDWNGLAKADDCPPRASNAREVSPQYVFFEFVQR